MTFYFAQSSYESLIIKRSLLTTYTAPWECFTLLHGNLKGNIFQSAGIQETSGISLSRLTAYQEGPIRSSHLVFTSLHFNARNPSAHCQHSHAWKRPYGHPSTYWWRNEEGAHIQ